MNKNEWQHLLDLVNRQIEGLQEIKVHLEREMAIKLPPNDYETLESDLDQAAERALK